MVGVGGDGRHGSDDRGQPRRPPVDGVVPAGGTSACRMRWPVHNDGVKRDQSRRCRAALAALVVALAGPSLAAGVVRVSFVEPQRFADVGFVTADREQVLARLESHLLHWGARHLRDGESLAIDVLDVDLAGEEQPGPRGNPRLLRGGADFPRLRLRYVLQVGGRVVSQGEERLVDMDYLERRTSVRTDEPLFYERRLLDEWLVARIEPLLPAPR